MIETHLYLSPKNPQDILIETLQEMVHPLVIVDETSYKGSFVVDESDILTPLEVYELIAQDFDPEVTALSISVDIDYLNDEWIFDALALIKPNFYTLEAFLYQAVLRAPQLAPSLKKRLEPLLDEELIKTMIAYAHHEMNASITAKALYIHRNTFQYRMNLFEKKMKLNPRRFETLALLHALFA
jgi:hypothetical protein